MICAAVSLPIHSFVSYGFFFLFLAEAAAFSAQSFKADASPKAPSPFAVLASAAIKGADQKIFRHHDSSLTAEDAMLLFDLLAG